MVARTPLDCPHEGCTVKPRGRYALEKHIRTHSDERPFACSYDGCDRSFKQSHNLKSHIRTHTNERPFLCPEDGCSLAFKRSDHLADHILSHGTDEPFECEECDAKFKLKNNLRAHVRVVHEDVRNVVCTFEGCGMRFTDSYKLESHKRVHTGERPYCCPRDGCEKAFSHSQTLTHHLNVHDGVRPFVCQEENCSAAFSYSGSLRLHEKCHLVERPIHCPDENCDATFTRNQHLKGHMEAFHTPGATLRRKIQEEAMKVALQDAGFSFSREHYVDYRCMGDPEGCSARVDFMLILNGVVVFLEVDEYQHADRSQLCECARMAKIVESICLGGNTLPIIFLRFNPHDYLKNEKKQYTSKKDRYAKLMEELRSMSDPDEMPPMQIRYMYYDVDGADQLCCFEDEDYFDVLKEVVTKVIV